MGDHVIDLVDAEEHNEEEVEEAEIRDDVAYLMKDKVFPYPEQDGEDQ
jgi:hypothetical protein